MTMLRSISFARSSSSTLPASKSAKGKLEFVKALRRFHGILNLAAKLGAGLQYFGEQRVNGPVEASLRVFGTGEIVGRGKVRAFLLGVVFTLLVLSILRVLGGVVLLLVLFSSGCGLSAASSSTGVPSPSKSNSSGFRP